MLLRQKLRRPQNRKRKKRLHRQKRMRRQKKLRRRPPLRRQKDPHRKKKKQPGPVPGVQAGEAMPQRCGPTTAPPAGQSSSVMRLPLRPGALTAAIIPSYPDSLRGHSNPTMSFLSSMKRKMRSTPLRTTIREKCCCPDLSTIQIIWKRSRVSMFLSGSTAVM